MSNSTLQCEGGCTNHAGRVTRVLVSHGNHNWGWFNYCEIARGEDKRRGLKVEFENVSCSQCGNDFGLGEHGYSHCSDHAQKSKKCEPKS